MAKKINKIYITYTDNAEIYAEDWHYQVSGVFENYTDAHNFLYYSGYRMTDRSPMLKHSIGNWWESIEPDEYTGYTGTAWIEEWEVH